MPSKSEVDWRSSTLNKGCYMSHDVEEGNLTVSRLDRTIDPYLAGVVMNGVIVYTGLHATLADARKTCVEKANLHHV